MLLLVLRWASNMMTKCVSVLGGWQTQINNRTLVGPVFNKIQDLWEWQVDNSEDLQMYAGEINDNWYDEQFELDVELEF
jgi:hypothetical protein